MNKKIIYIGFFAAAMAFSSACSIDEEIQDEVTKDVIDKDPNLLANMVAPPLGQLRNFWYRERIWGLQETTSDECFFPTRGSDWFDGGVWVDNYTHQWTPTHRDVVGTWNALNSAISSCNTALFNIGHAKANEDIKVTNYRSQANFLRSFYEYNLYDLYRKYPVRDPFDLDFENSAAKIYEKEAGFNRLITIAKTLPDQMLGKNKTLYGEPNKNAALMLIAKLYLNKEVYTGSPAYDSCLIYLDKIIASNSYALSNNYFDMFSVDNEKRYALPDDEAILVAVYSDDQNYGVDDQVQWVKTTFHYNQSFGGFSNWNGAAVPEGYLIKNWINGSDTATDVRWKNNSIKTDMGINLGFNYGQQYNTKGVALKDRSGNPLIFTFEVPLSGAKEYHGVRVLKYPPRKEPVNTARTPNDFVIWRFADVLLMKAECLVRANNDIAGAVALINQIRIKRNTTPITAATKEEILDKILTERALELYWEGHRRQDMIRFGTFLLPKSEKPEASPARAILLPIPQAAIDGTKDGSLKQNEGY